MTETIDVRRATTADIPFMMRTERLEGYADMVGCWEEERHRAALADPDHACFVAAAAGRPVGFALLRGWASADHMTLVRRVAISEPGRGFGAALMRILVDTAFTETEVHRLSIDCFTNNERARRTYEAVGFLAEGIARGSFLFRGEYRDLLILAMLRPDWEARRVVQSSLPVQGNLLE